MLSLRILLSRIRAMFEHAKADRELDAEVQSHLDLLAKRFIRQGMSAEEARYKARRQFGALATQYPGENKNHASTYILPELERVVGDSRQSMFVLLAAVFVLLLIACANIANLVMARSVEREREVAVRAAMGASRANVVRQLLMEGLALGFLGSLAGLLLAFACLRIFLPLAGDSIPRISLAAVDRRVLAFSITLALFTSILFSLLPALQAAKVDLVRSLKEGARG